MIEVEEYMDIAYKMAKKYRNVTGEDLDEAEGICLEVLVIAGQQFDPDKGISFETYATSLMYQKMIDVGRRNKLKKRRLIFAPESTENEMEWLDSLSRKAIHIESKVVTNIALDHLIYKAWMTKRQRQVVGMLLFNHQLTQQEIAEWLGVSPQRVNTIIKDMSRRSYFRLKLFELLFATGKEWEGING